MVATTNNPANCLLLIFIFGVIIYWCCSKKSCECQSKPKKENLSITGFPPRKQSCIRYESVGNMYEYCPRAQNWP